jgi:hypothetical protein
MKHWFNDMERALAVDRGAEFLGKEYTHIWQNPRQLVETLDSNPHYYRIVYHPSNMQTAFSWCGRAMWMMPHTRWLLVDELHEICSPHFISPDMNTYLRYARHNFIGFIGSSQRISDVSRLFTQGSRMTILFHTEEAADMDAIYARWGKAVRRSVENLRPCIYDDATGVCEQHPECVCILRGRGYRILSLGDKIKTGEEKQWQKLGQEEPQRQEPSSSVLPSGNREQS